MSKSMIEQMVESAVEDALGEKAVRVIKGVGKIAAKQGGETSAENYRLLGKRALVTIGVAFVAVQVAASAVNFVVSRKSEEQRVERIVRRVLEEERQRQAVEAAAAPSVEASAEPAVEASAEPAVETAAELSSETAVEAAAEA